MRIRGLSRQAWRAWPAACPTVPLFLLRQHLRQHADRLAACRKTLDRIGGSTRKRIPGTLHRRLAERDFFCPAVATIRPANQSIRPPDSTIRLFATTASRHYGTFHTTVEGELCSFRLYPPAKSCPSEKTGYATGCHKAGRGCLPQPQAACPLRRHICL